MNKLSATAHVPSHGTNIPLPKTSSALIMNKNAKTLTIIAVLVLLSARAAAS